MPDLIKRLDQPGILIADGATGSMLQKAGLPIGAAPERWILENPEAIHTLHKSYIDAGTDIILTDTFGGNRLRLEREHLQANVHRINLTAARIARQEAGSNLFVFGDIGPTGQLFEPLGPLTMSEATEIFAEQAAALAEGGVDAILIETMSDLNEAKAAVAGAKKACQLPILVTMSFDSHGRTMMGVKPEIAVRELWSLGVSAVGANCGRTLEETLTAITAMRAAEPNAVLMAKPNAGLPRIENGEATYDVTPQVMAEYAHKFAQQSVKIFGGCCGSTPEHIRAVTNALKY
jgi:5-methyltetrahydrofolate--homocysteine methyltransferase